MRTRFILQPALPLAVFLLATFTLPASAFDRTPLPVSDRNPLSQIFGLPPMGSATPLPQRRYSTELGYEVANYMYYQSGPSETLVLDGEVHRLALRVTQGTHWGDWGIEIPFLSHDPGFLDGFIRRWHDLFGMPQGGRDQIADDQLVYRYSRNGIEQLNVTRSSEGIGDIRLYSGWTVPHQALEVVVRASVKLPTGDAERLHGSGAPDVAIWMVAGCSITACQGPWSWTTGAGLLWLGRGDVLPDRQRRSAIFGEAGLHWSPSASVTLKTALYSHSPFYRGTDQEPLGQTSIQLILGGSWAISGGTVLDLGVSEDVRVNTAPDVGILINIRSSF